MDGGCMTYWNVYIRLYETSAQPIYYKLVNTVYTHERHHDILGIVRGHDVV